MVVGTSGVLKGETVVVVRQGGEVTARSLGSRWLEAKGNEA